MPKYIPPPRGPDEGYLPSELADALQRCERAEENARHWMRQHERRRAANIRLEAQINALIAEIGYIITARRFDRDTFVHDTEFADWALSRLRDAHAKATAKPEIATYRSPE